MLEHSRAILASESPRKRDIENLQNWVDNKASVARDETAYLYKPRDLMTILLPRDDALARLTPLTERVVSGLYRLLKKVSHSGRNSTHESKWTCFAAAKHRLTGS